MIVRFLIIALILPILAACAQAVPEPPAIEGDWTLVPEDSQVAFVSIKAGDVGEAHRFKAESGGVDGAGKAQVSIDLASVDTQVDIRDERMRNILFQVGQFPSATVTTEVDPKAIETLKPGEQKLLTSKFTLDLHGVSGTFDGDIAITRISDDRVSVETVKPVIVDANQFALGDGLDQLQALAGLPSISPAVPVTASLVFKRK